MVTELSLTDRSKCATPLELQLAIQQPTNTEQVVNNFGQFSLSYAPQDPSREIQFKHRRFSSGSAQASRPEQESTLFHFHPYAVHTEDHSVYAGRNHGDINYALFAGLISRRRIPLDSPKLLSLTARDVLAMAPHLTFAKIGDSANVLTRNGISLEEFLAAARNLKELHISHKDLDTCPALPTVEKLTLECPKLRQIPQGMTRLRNLTCRNVGIQGIPEEISRQLSFLVVDNCPDFESLPEEMPHIEILSLEWLPKLMRVPAYPSLGILRVFSDPNEMPHLPNRRALPRLHTLVTGPKVQPEAMEGGLPRRMRRQTSPLWPERDFGAHPGWKDVLAEEVEKFENVKPGPDPHKPTDKARLLMNKIFQATHRVEGNQEFYRDIMVRWLKNCEAANNFGVWTLLKPEEKAELYPMVRERRF